MAENSEDDKVEIALWLDRDTETIGKIVVPYISDEQAEIFFDTIEDYFYRQGGEIRKCKYCDCEFPYFPLGISFDFCMADKCFDDYLADAEHNQYFMLGFLRNSVKSPAPDSPHVVKEPAPPKTKRPIRVILPGARPGYVYLMRSENGLHKIGRAKNIETRRQGLERDIPVKVTVVHTILCGNYIEAEKKIHARYSEQRVRYEWFELSSGQVTEIMKIKDHELD